VARQDAELRLLENMKRCLSLRIKCDREYAIALNTVVLQVNTYIFFSNRISYVVCMPGAKDGQSGASWKLSGTVLEYVYR